MKKVEKNFIEAAESSAARSRCGRCGAVIHEDNFCSECREFFLRLNGREQVLSAEARRTPRERSMVNGQ